MTKTSGGSLRRRVLLLGIIALLGVLPRLSHVGRSYILDFHAWRQTDSAAFARGYLIDSFNPFSPSIDRYPCKGKHAPFGRVEAELPIVPFLAAVPLKLLGMTDASAPYLRLVSIAVFVLGCFALFQCVLALEGDVTDALLAVAAFCVAPLAIFFTRSPQPDGQSLSVAFASVCYVARYTKSRSWRDALAAAGCTCVLLLMKISNAYLGLVLLYIVLSELGLKASLRDPKLWLVLLIVCIPTAAWYWHARGFAWSFGIWGDGPDNKFTNQEKLWNPANWQKLLARMQWDVLTAGGSALMVIGLAVKIQTRMIRVALVWLLAAVVFMVLTLGGQLRHVYYQLCLIPPAAIAQALGARHLFERAWLGRTLLAACLTLHIAITSSVLWGSSPWSSIEGLSYFTQDPMAREPIEALRRLLPPDAMFVTSEHDPRLYWNSRHRGYFWESANGKGYLRCMKGVSDYLLLNAKARARVMSEPDAAQRFEEIWANANYSLYRRAEQAASP